jgi:hypothetical protein
LSSNGSVRFCVYDTDIHRPFIRNGNAGKHIHNLARLKSLNVGDIISELKTFNMNTLQAVLLKVEIKAAASGMPSTWELLSAVPRAATEAPHAAVIAGLTARDGGELMRP